MLATHLAAGLFVSAVAVELALRLPLLTPAGRIAATSQKALRMMANGAVSDHWKERAMLAYAGRTFAAVGLFVLALAALLGALAVIALSIDVIAPGFSAFLVSLPGLGLTLVAATVWMLVRRRAAPA